MLATKPMEAKDALKRFDASKKRKIQFTLTYQQATRFSTPERDQFFYHIEGARNDRPFEVCDSTAPRGVNSFVSNLQSSLVPPGKRFVKFTPGFKIPEDRRQNAQIQLEGIEEAIFAIIHNSNFDVTVPESFTDLAVGTGAFMVQRGLDPGSIHHIAVPLHQLWLEEGPNGIITTVFRLHKIPARNITETWDDAELDAETQKRYEDKPDAEIEFLECTYPYREKVKGKTVTGFYYQVIDKVKKKVIVERKEGSSPWIVFRWSVLPGEIYGRGPLITALADIKTLNKTKQLILENASLAVAGAWTVLDDGTVNVDNIQIEPGTLITVSSNPGSPQGPMIAPLKPGGDFNVAQLIIQDLVQSIEAMLYTNPLGRIDLPVKSATEMTLRQQALAKQIGAAFGRLSRELIVPYLNRVIWLANDMKEIDVPSDFLVDNKIVGIDYLSPLAQAQDQDDVMALMNFVNVVTQAFPQLASLILKPLKVIEALAQKSRVSMELIATEDEFKQGMQAMQQAAMASAPAAQPQGQ